MSPKSYGNGISPQTNPDTTSYPTNPDTQARTSLRRRIVKPDPINGYRFRNPGIVIDARDKKHNLVLVETKRMIRSPYLSGSNKPKPEGYLDFIYNAMKEASGQPVVTGTMYINSRVPENEVLGDFRLRFDIHPDRLRKVFADIDPDEIAKEIEDSKSGRRMVSGIEELEYLLLIRDLVLKGKVDPMELFEYRDSISATDRYNTDSERYLTELDERDGRNRIRLLSSMSGHVTERYAREILRESNGFCQAYDYNNIANDEQGHEGESDMLVAIKSEADVRRLLANLEGFGGEGFGATDDLRLFMNGSMNIADFQALKDIKRERRILAA